VVPREGGARPEAAQEEDVGAPGVGKFCVVLRTSTEHPGAVEAGYAKVMGFEIFINI
jgi:UDP-N-acetylglucosamine 2-epimerase